MVDPKVYVPGVSDSGQVLTFTVSEAIKFNFCEAKVSSIEELLERTGNKDSEIIRHQLSVTDKIIGWLINPFVSGILIMIIVGGIYFELQTPGIGFPIAAAAFAALLYFAPLYIEGLANNWEILIFVVGLILIAVEIFAIPGFGVAGVLGITLMVSGLTLSMVDQIGPGLFDYDLSKLVKAFFIVIIAFFISIVSSIALSKQLFATNRFGNLALAKTQLTDEGYSSAQTSYTEMIQKTGTSRTILRPAGKIEIDGDLYDAVALTSYIDKGVKVIVVDYHNAQLVVKKA
jgi:membrane-bound serine protease (ClpP class)